MELDPQIKVTDIQDTATFEKTGTVTPQTRYTYFIGGHGPFTLVFDRGTDTEALVHGALTTHLQKLQNLGVVKKG